MVDKKYFISTQEECESLLNKLNTHFGFPNENTITYSVIMNITNSSNKVLILKSTILNLLTSSELSKVSDTCPDLNLDI